MRLWLELSLHSQKVTVSQPTWFGPFWVEFAYSLCACFSGSSSFVLQPINIHFRLVDYSNPLICHEVGMVVYLHVALWWTCYLSRMYAASRTIWPLEISASPHEPKRAKQVTKMDERFVCIFFLEYEFYAKRGHYNKNQVKMSNILELIHLKYGSCAINGNF